MRWREIILESVKKFEPMFSIFKTDGRMPAWVATRIRSVEAMMKREDRVVWCLRIERYMAIKKSNLANRDALLARSAREIGDEDGIRIYEEMIRDHFAHWFSLESRQIDSVVFGRQTPKELWTELVAAEDEWKATRKQLLNHEKDYPHNDESEDGEYDDEDEDYDPDEEDYEREKRERQKALAATGNIFKVIDFHDGWAWWNLNRAYCTTEGGAMGHCGNQPSAVPGDTVLSLRRDMGNGNFRPSLTFIFNTDTGMLIEMKGRANEKPAARYHDMIVALLKNPLIHGCQGGGYAAQNNFTVLDLPEDVRNELVAQKPALLTIYDKLDLYKAKPSEELGESIEKEITKKVRSYGLSIDHVDLTRRKIIIKEWSSIDNYIRSTSYTYRVDSLKEFFDNLEDNLIDIFYKKDRDNENKERDAGIMANDAKEKMFVNILERFLDYPDADFILDGVNLHYNEKERTVELVISINDFINPSSDYYYEMDEDEDAGMPILDRLPEFDAGQYEHDYSWDDMSENFSHGLDEVETAIAKSCFYHGNPKNNSDHTKAVDLVYDEFSGSGDSVHYHSRDPNQLNLDLGDK